MKRMEDDGVIRGYTIREAGIGLTALIRLKVGSGVEIGSLAGEYSGWAGVECIYEISGDADLVAIVHVDDTISLRNLFLLYKFICFQPFQIYPRGSFSPHGMTWSSSLPIL